MEDVVNKANIMLGMIRRAYTFLDGPTLTKLYTSLIRPAAVAWTPVIKRDQLLLENVQRRTTKLVPSLKNYSYEDRLRILNLPSLYYRRARGDIYCIVLYNLYFSLRNTEQHSHTVLGSIDSLSLCGATQGFIIHYYHPPLYMIETWKYLHGQYNVNQMPLQRDANTTTRGRSMKLRKERCLKRRRRNFFRHRL